MTRKSDLTFMVKELFEYELPELRMFKNSSERDIALPRPAIGSDCCTTLFTRGPYSPCYI